MLVLFSCEGGEILSNKSNGIIDVITQFDWYLLPIEIKQMLPMLIINAQQPMLLKFFGNVSCSREQYKKVCVIRIIQIDDIFISLAKV